MTCGTRITKTRMAGPDHAVSTIVGGRGDLYRREPCPECPWRIDQTGVFPAEAFKHSAPVSYDCAMTVFACHQSGSKNPATCAGFLLRNAANNLMVRMKMRGGRIDPSTISDGGLELHASYRAMAVANGVYPDDLALSECRADNE